MGRYYDQKGVFQKGAGLREAREKGLVPSVTTVLEIINKEFLNRWKVKQNLSIAFSLDTTRFDNEQEFIKYVEDLFSLDKKAIEYGNDIHNALEDAVNGKEVSSKYKYLCDSITSDIHDICGELGILKKARTEKNIVGDGYCGTIDLFYETSDRIYIFDYKTQNSEINKIKKYNEWIMQLAAYALALKKQIKKPVSIYNIVINRKTEYKVIKYSYKELCRGQRLFRNTFKVWQDYKKFYCEDMKNENTIL